MHELSIPADLVARVTKRTGRPHPFDVIEPAKTAFVVVDMQNYFVKPGFQGEVPKARAIVPAVNRLAAALRELGGHVVWVKNATNDTRESWSVFHDWLNTPERRDRRYASMDLAHEALEVDQVLLLERVGLVIGKGSIGLHEERLRIHALQMLEDGRKRVARHAVGGIDGEGRMDFLIILAFLVVVLAPIATLALILLGTGLLKMLFALEARPRG